jgi:hypothetical protein
MVGGFVRGLLLVVLALGVAGFGVCSLCGGVFGVASLFESKPSARELAWIGFGFAVVAGVLAWVCWLGFRGLRKAMRSPPPGSETPGP